VGTGYPLLKFGSVAMCQHARGSWLKRLHTPPLLRSRNNQVATVSRQFRVSHGRGPPLALRGCARQLSGADLHSHGPLFAMTSWHPALTSPPICVCMCDGSYCRGNPICGVATSSPMSATVQRAARCELGPAALPWDWNLSSGEYDSGFG